jgi:hypothetical protein
MHFVELGQLLGGHGQVGVEDHEDLAGGGGEAGMRTASPLPLAGLLEEA